MTNLYHWTGTKFVQDVGEPRDYTESILYALEFCRAEYLRNGQQPLPAEDAFHTLICSDSILVLGETWFGVFEVETPWFLQDQYLGEHLFGPRSANSTVDLRDFVAAGTALAELTSSRYFTFGTRANSRPQAMARLSEQLGMRLVATTLEKEIDNG